MQWTCQIVIYSRLSLNIERFCFLDYFNVVQSKSCLDYLVLCKLNLVLSCISLVSSFFSPFLGFIQAVLLMSVFWVLYSHIVRKDTVNLSYTKLGVWRHFNPLQHVLDEGMAGVQWAKTLNIFEHFWLFYIWRKIKWLQLINLAS